MSRLYKRNRHPSYKNVGSYAEENASARCFAEVGHVFIKPLLLPQSHLHRYSKSGELRIFTDSFLHGAHLGKRKGHRVMDVLYMA